MKKKISLLVLLLATMVSCKDDPENPKIYNQDGNIVIHVYGRLKGGVKPPSTSEPGIQSVSTAVGQVCCPLIDYEVNVVSFPCEIEYPVSFHPVEKRTILDSLTGIWSEAATPWEGMALLTNIVNGFDTSSALVMLGQDGNIMNTQRYSVAGQDVVGNVVHLCNDGEWITAGTADDGTTRRLFCRRTTSEGVLRANSLTDKSTDKVVAVFDTPEGDQLVATLRSGAGSCGSSNALNIFLLKDDNFLETISHTDICIETNHMIGITTQDGSPTLAWAEGEDLKVMKITGTFPSLVSNIQTFKVGPELVLRSGSIAENGAMLIGGRTGGTAFLLETTAGGTSRISYPLSVTTESWVDGVHIDCNGAVVAIVNMENEKPVLWVMRQSLLTK